MFGRLPSQLEILKARFRGRDAALKMAKKKGVRLAQQGGEGTTFRSAMGLQFRRLQAFLVIVCHSPGARKWPHKDCDASIPHHG
ncbi:MAG: hypothetical protein DMG30_06640 [Acidobacteria bacterium]|nr:MAG: hypothetical protein DMG30_06640 [Acidobacteriota bacterium]